jgi:tRNA threonylcarbamoyladenosine biosynthesis protein TsaE
MTIVLDTVERTTALGVELGRRLRAGDLVILSGSLGAGKTTLTKGIADGMGVLGRVTSPTFVIARVHRPVQGTVPLVHVDAYRISGTVELDDLDLDTDLAASAVVIEWGEGVAEQLSDERLVIDLERLPDDTRTATITPVGAGWESRFAELGRSLDTSGAEPGIESPYGLR